MSPPPQKDGPPRCRRWCHRRRWQWRWGQAPRPAPLAARVFEDRGSYRIPRQLEVMVLISHVAGNRKEPRRLPLEKVPARLARCFRLSQRTAPRAPGRGSSGSTARREGIRQIESPHRQTEGACCLLAWMLREQRGGLADSCRRHRRRHHRGCCCCCCRCCYDPQMLGC